MAEILIHNTIPDKLQTCFPELSFSAIFLLENLFNPFFYLEIVSRRIEWTANQFGLWKINMSFPE